MGGTTTSRRLRSRGWSARRYAVHLRDLWTRVLLG
jgi:hypothetical protein